MQYLNAAGNGAGSFGPAGIVEAEFLEGTMVKRFCKSGESEVVKGAVHAAGGVLAGVMAAYNLAAWCYRREPHLGINVIVYTLAVLWEVKQTTHHFERVEIVRSEGAVLVHQEKTQAA